MQDVRRAGSNLAWRWIVRHSIKAVAVLGVFVVVASCSDVPVSPSSLLTPGSNSLGKEPRVEKKALLRVCKLSSANERSRIDRDRLFHFRRSDGVEFDLKFNGCTEPREVAAGERTLIEPHDRNAPAAFSYFATKVLVTNGTLLSSSGFHDRRPTTATDASVRIRLTSGQLTTVTFFNRN
jgi:hypothetical protein